MAQAKPGRTSGGRITCRPMAWSDWVRTVEVEPSIYAADFSRLGEQLEGLLRAGARVMHFDVGDGHFVPPVTIGPVVLRSISPLIRSFDGKVDCHLMVDNPTQHFSELAQSGADSVTVHYEVVGDRLPEVVAHAREHGLEIGLAFNPETTPEIAAAAAIEAKVDFVLCMSIKPGYSGQPLMPEAPGRIRLLSALLPPSIFVQVDGGVGHDNIRSLYDEGARLFVAGTSIFGREDLARAYRRLVELLK
jgi:ribulose-phosphate 3-epimerase